MANSLFKTPGFTPQVKHNGFDMSMRRLFTAPVGMMLPVYTDIVQANDKYKLNVDSFIRTEAVQTAAFQNFKAHFDWFFVPFRQMYSFWNEFYNGIFDANTNFVSVNDNYSLPTVDFDFYPRTIDTNTQLSDYYTVVQGDNVVATYDGFGTPRLGAAVRLCDMLGYGDLHRFADTVSNQNFKIFPYKFLAYHKIFYHPKFYRSEWFNRDTSLFNVDSYHGKTIDALLGHKIMSTIHYRPYRRDYFSGVFPNPVFSKDFANIVGDSWLKGQYTISQFAPEYTYPNGSETYNNLVVADGKNAGQFGYPYSTSGFAQSVKLNTDTGQIDVDSLNALYDFDKLCRITALAGSHYTDQLEAHFGVKVNNDIHNEAYYIGSQSVDISISEVVATASTGASSVGSNLGDIAGKGFGASTRGGDLNFEAKEQGVLMCVFSIEPLQMYNSNSIERNGLYKDPLDFYRRELDNLGMQPMLRAELNTGRGDLENAVIGFNYRYAELKTKVDLVNLGFTTVKTDWQCNFQNAISLHTANKTWRFYINPSYTDSIFAMSYIKPDYIIGTASSHFDDWSKLSNMDIFKGDNFLINAQFNVLKDSIMSVHSLPSLN